MSESTNRIHLQLNTIQKRYDPENDLASPRVSWTEYELSLIVRTLATTIERLESRIEALEIAKTSPDNNKPSDIEVSVT